MHCILRGFRARHTRCLSRTRHDLLTDRRSDLAGWYQANQSFPFSTLLTLKLSCTRPLSVENVKSSHRPLLHDRPGSLALGNGAGYLCQCNTALTRWGDSVRRTHIAFMIPYLYPRSPAPVRRVARLLTASVNRRSLILVSSHFPSDPCQRI